MSSGGDPQVAVPARAIGEPHRATMLTALLRGGHLTAGELAGIARVSAATASEHLRILQRANLVTVTQEGRHRYYRLASPAVAQALEALQTIAPISPVRSLRSSRVARELYEGRRCYDHLAGQLGIRVTRLLQDAGLVPPLPPPGTVITMPDPLPACSVSEVLHLQLRPPSNSRQPWARSCLDWTHQQPHLAGYLGKAVMESLTTMAWIRTHPDTRAVTLTPAGASGLDSLQTPTTLA